MLAMLGILGLTASARPEGLGRPVQTPQGVVYRLNNEILRVAVYGDRVMRVTRAPGEALPVSKSLAVIAEPVESGWSIATTPDAYVVATGVLQARVDRTSGRVTFASKSGDVVLQERAATIEPATFATGVSTRIRQSFVLRAKEAIFGLGQHPEGRWDYRGTSVHLQQRNGDIAVPVLYSSAGYGVLWDNPAVTDVHVGLEASPDTLTWDSEAGEAVDYYLLYGPGGDDIIRGYRHLTGDAPMWGRWAYGYWQCRERYVTQEEILGVAREYRRRQIPIDGMIQDWQYWHPHPWGSHAFGENFPDPAAMMRELHAADYHALISVWPKFDKGSANHKAMAAAGHLYPPVYPNVWPRGEAQWYDPFQAGARKMYWDQLAEQIFAAGFDGWWLDATEPELGGNWGEIRDLATGAGPGYRVYNAYPLLTTGAVYEGQRAATDAKRVFILTRSAYSGLQRHGAVAWSGDIGSDWETLRRQIPAGLNFVLTGIPYWNTDIGGFFSRSPDDPDYRECFTRWFQFGAFCPMFRVHGTNARKEMWQFGPQTEAILIAYDRLRYRLLPYIYSVAWQVTDNGYSLMRPLVMDFAKDPRAVRTGDQFLFGPALMVCPVTEPLGGVGTVIPAGNLVDAEGRPGGLSATYYQGRAFEEQKLIRRDETLSFDWDKTKREGVGANVRRDPLPGMVMDHFSARWEGALKTEEAGGYVLELAADDGMRLWIDGRQVIDDWNARAVVTRTATVDLPANALVPIRVEYFQYAGEAVIELRWKRPNQGRRAASRSVYLPAGGDWWDFWTGQRLSGGQTIAAPAPLEIMPLYVRAGSILPLGPVVQHAQAPVDPVEIRVYRGADGSFTWYEDAGDGYGYEDGAYATIPLSWDESKETLTVGPWSGSYPGMPAAHTFHVVFVDAGRGRAGEAARPDETVTLTPGETATVRPPQPERPSGID